MKWLLFLFFLMILPLISGSSFYIPQNQNYSITFNCQIDNSICSNTASCNVSIEYPNSSIMVRDMPSTNIGNGRFNYSLK